MRPMWRAGVESHMIPGLATVSGFVNTVAPGRTLAIVRLAGTDPDDRGIGRSDGKIADRRIQFLVKDRSERDAAIGGFPDAAGSGADEKCVGIVFNHGDIVDAAAHDGRADFAKLQSGQRGIDGGRRRGSAGSGGRPALLALPVSRPAVFQARAFSPAKKRRAARSAASVKRTIAIVILDRMIPFAIDSPVRRIYRYRSRMRADANPQASRIATERTYGKVGKKQSYPFFKDAWREIVRSMSTAGHMSWISRCVSQDILVPLLNWG